MQDDEDIVRLDMQESEAFNDFLVEISLCLFGSPRELRDFDKDVS